MQIVLRSTLRFACRQGYISKMPEGIPALKRTGQLVLDIPSDSEVHAIVTEAPYPLSTALKLMAYGGLRPNEVRGLRWRDVRLDGNGRGGGMMTVRRGVSFGQVHSPKTGQRDVPIAPPLYAELAEITDHELDEHVALMRDGRPLSQSALNAAFARLVKRLGLRHWPVYALRHYAITAWLRAGVPVHVVQRMAGHRNLSTTARYTHMVQGDLMRAVELFGNLLATVPERVGPSVRSAAVFSRFPVAEGEVV
ncbi:MAG: site-specific integrase [Myxococcales bacterium]|nr:site-specific integrase [Myxococcales bacterium]